MGKIVLTSYISHGAPTSLVERTKIHEVYEALGGVLKAHGIDTVIVSSPHYFSREGFEVESRENIPCLRDYYGFPDELQKFSYEAKNNTKLVTEILRQSKEAGIDAAGSKSWGLDHGAWLPLHFIFPKRDVKVVPVSITGASPGDHFKFGLAIKSAVERIDVTAAIIGTGSPVHRLDLVRYGYYGEDRFEPGAGFDDKLIGIVASGDFGKILKIREEHPSAFAAAAPEGGIESIVYSSWSFREKEFLWNDYFTRVHVLWNLSNCHDTEHGRHNAEIGNEDFLRKEN